MNEQFHARSPHEAPISLSVATLVQHWSDARTRAFMARHGGHAVDPADLFTELALGARIAVDVQSGRWCAVAELLRVGAVESWWEIGTALDITETEARDGFHAWITGQVDLRHRTGTIGLTDTDAAELYRLSEAVTL